MNNRYSYGEFELNINQRFTVPKVGWYLTQKEKPATGRQQKQLELLGWGRDNVMFWGAEAIIQEILEYVWE